MHWPSFTSRNALFHRHMVPVCDILAPSVPAIARVRLTELHVESTHVLWHVAAVEARTLPDKWGSGRGASDDYPPRGTRGRKGLGE